MVGPRGIRFATILLAAAFLALAAVLFLAPQAWADLTFPPPQDLSATGESAFGPEVAVDSQDRATVVWSTGDAVQSTRGNSR